ncbi:MAG: carboxypeptidase-like regulatory domain-containing protein [Thermoguttaceae bacterium]
MNKRNCIRMALVVPIAFLSWSFMSHLAMTAENKSKSPEPKHIDLQVQVADPSGKPIAGAVIRVWTMPETKPLEWPLRGEPVLIADQKEILTGDDGKAVFSISAPATAASSWKPPSLFSLTATAENYLVARSGGIGTADSDHYDLTLTLRRLVNIDGRVIDQQGRPVAEATVFHTGNASSRVETKTDAQGRFHLQNLPEGTAPVFVTHPDYLFHGQLVDTSAATQEFKLLGKDQAPAPLATLPPPFSRQQELDLAKQIIVPLWETAMKSTNESEKQDLSESYAQLDPWHVFGEVEKRLNNEEKNRFIMQTFRLLYPADPEEAMALLESLNIPEETKTLIIIRTVQEALDLSRKQKLDLLNRAIAYSRSSQDPIDRIDYLSSIASTLYVLDQVDDAKKLVEELKPLIEKLTPKENAHACAVGGAAISLFELQAGLRIVRSVPDDFYRMRILFRIAQRLAAKDPAEAERIIDESLDDIKVKAEKAFQDAYQREWPELNKQSLMNYYECRTTQVCYYMAPADADRAERIALKVRNPHQRAYCLGMVAKALAATDKAKAKKLILNSYQILAEASANPQRYWLGWQSSPLRTAGALLPVVEQIDPALLSECIWHAVSFRLFRPADDFMIGMEPESDDAFLAMYLSRYDRLLAAAIFPKASTINPPPSESYLPAEAWIFIDPGQILPFPGKISSIRHYDEKNIVALLSLDPSRRWDAMTSQHSLWTPGWEHYQSLFSSSLFPW